MFWQFWQKKLNELSEVYGKNGKYSKTRIANCSKTLLQMFIAILAKIDSIGIACKNLVFESAKIARVTRNFVAPKRHPNNLSQEYQE